MISGTLHRSHCGPQIERRSKILGDHLLCFGPRPNHPTTGTKLNNFKCQCFTAKSSVYGYRWRVFDSEVRFLEGTHLHAPPKDKPRLMFNHLVFDGPKRAGVCEFRSSFGGFPYRAGTNGLGSEFWVGRPQSVGFRITPKQAKCVPPQNSMVCHHFP